MARGTGKIASTAAGYDPAGVRAGLASGRSAQQAGARKQGPPPGGRRVARAAALLIPGAAAAVAGGYQLGRPSLWRDEAYTLDAAHRTYPQIITLLRHTDAVNGAYYLLMHPVIAVFGASAIALRAPSVIAMAVAAVLTAAIGRRLARAGGLPAPALTGMLAGLLLAAAPLATQYAQDARSYAIVTMLAAAATLLLLRAAESNGWRWWLGYGAAVAVLGLFHLLALLLVVAHGVSLAIARARNRRPAGPRVEPARGEPAPVEPARGEPAPVETGQGEPSQGEPSQGEPSQGEPNPAISRRPAPAPARVALTRWLTAAAGAAVVVAPLAALGTAQSQQIGWLPRPGLPAVDHLVIAFAGSRSLAPVMALLAAGGIAASFTGARRGLDAATVALPWLVLPPAILIAVSQAHPLYDSRYVVFCLPALALLAAAGLAWLARLAAPLGRAGGPAWTRAALTWLPSVAVLAGVAIGVAGPQQSVRSPWAHPDNLRKAARIVAAGERPGDAVLYIPANKRAAGMAYPAPFQRLRDVALAKSPVAAGNLIGTQVSAPVLSRLLARVSRVWVVTGRGLGVLTRPKTAMERAEVAALRAFRLIGRWRAGGIALSLFARSDLGRSAFGH